MFTKKIYFITYFQHKNIRNRGILFIIVYITLKAMAMIKIVFRVSRRDFLFIYQSKNYQDHIATANVSNQNDNKT
jgi:hypothetical protein